MSDRKLQKLREKMEQLSKVPLFEPLDKLEIHVLAELSEWQFYHAGEVIFEKGGHGSSLYIIGYGEVAITEQPALPGKSGGAEQGESLARFIENELFGENEFFEDSAHSAFAVASEDCRILVFPREGTDRRRLFDQNARIFARIYHHLIATNARKQRDVHRLIAEKTGWIEDLKRKMFFDKLTGTFNRTYLEDELVRKTSELIGDSYCLMVIKPDNFKLINDTFGHEAGDAALKAIADRITSLVDKNDLVIRYRGNEFIIIKPALDLKEGVRFGAYYLQSMTDFDIGLAMKRESLFQTFSIGVTVCPEHETDLIQLVEMAFAAVFQQREKGGNGLMAARTAGSNSLIDLLQSLEIFSTLTLSELDQLSRHLSLLQVEQGQSICCQGDPGDELYIIKSGATSVRINTGEAELHEIAQIGAGEFFGEMAIFEDAPRSATCVALEHCEVYSLNKNDFFELMKRYPATALKIMQSILDKTSKRVHDGGHFIARMVQWGEEASLRAITDKLTGLFNRRYLESELSKTWHDAVNSGRPFALLMADMDYFREVNEGYSHEIGDLYIVEVAGVFKSNFRKGDVVARYGGDEFTILLPDTDQKTAFDVADSVRQEVQKLSFLDSYDGPDLNPSVSLGLACYPGHGNSMAEIQKHADEALYVAKNNGRNQTAVYDPDKAPVNH